jgi:hypothetical protein
MMRKVIRAVIVGGKGRLLPTSDFDAGAYDMRLSETGVLHVTVINQATNDCGRQFAVTGDMHIELEADAKPEAKRR